MLEIIKNIAAVVGCISACIALGVTIFKPLRKVIVNGILHEQKDNENTQKLDTVFHKLDNTLDAIGELKQDMIQVNDEMKKEISKLNKRIDEIESHVLENEMDRLKSELARYAAICRRGEPIYESDYLHIQEVYEKYHVVLNGNHTGTDNFNTIKEYFEAQMNIK